MNGLVWQAIYNVINSYNLIEMESSGMQGIIKSDTHAPEDIFIGRVRVLEDTVMAIIAPDQLYTKEETEAKAHEEPEDVYHGIYKAILKLLQRKGHIRFKPPRDFADD